MSETTLLRSSAIVRNATVAPPQHGPVKTGELPLVQVRMTQGGPQVQEGQQRPVQILPPKDAAAAVATGGLPMVNVKMTQNGPQLDDGQNHPVVIRDAPSRGGVAAGGLSMVQVQMTPSGPQVQTQSNIQGGPPQIPAAPPALSSPRGTLTAPVARQGYVARPAYPVANQSRVARVAAPQVAPQVAPPQVPVLDLTVDQLMLCRHLAEKYLAEVRVVPVDATDDPDGTVEDSDAADLAATTIAAIDGALAATAAQVEAAALTAAAPTPVPATIASPAATSIAPAPSVAYNAGRVGARSYVAGGARSQRNAGMAPRRTVREGAPLPPVVVKMEGRQAVVQNRAEVEQAKAAASVVPAEESSAREAPSPTPPVDGDARD
jgi:hypothetical protein